MCIRDRGMIKQIGIWTEQPLWKANGASEQYNLHLVKGLNDVAVGLAEQHQPLSLILSANPSNTGADTTCLLYTADRDD